MELLQKIDVNVNVNDVKKLEEVFTYQIVVKVTNISD